MKSSERFSDRASDYVAGRPSYPDAAIDEIFRGLPDPKRLTVVDLGAGTGISARLLAARGAPVIAVEPNAAMRGKAIRAEGVVWQEGTAEHTGLGAASIDLVTAFQAFHWFDHVAALYEIDRIVRPGGHIALVHNQRDERDPFTAAFGALVRAHTILDDSAPELDAGHEALRSFPSWGRFRTITVENAHVLDRAGLLARTRSVSYLPKEGAAFKALQLELDVLFDSFSDARSVTMHMKTAISVRGPKA